MQQLAHARGYAPCHLGPNAAWIIDGRHCAEETGGFGVVGAEVIDSALFHDEPTIEAFPLGGLELSARGNHALDERLAELEPRVEHFRRGPRRALGGYASCARRGQTEGIGLRVSAPTQRCP